MKIEKIADYGERLFVVLLILPFLLALTKAGSARPYLLLLAVSESLAVGLIIFRGPGQMVVKPYPLAVAFLGTAAPLLVRPENGGTAVLSAAFAAFVMGTGLAINIWAKIILWRSFGLTAANRGVKVGGPYRLVRHPMYLGYFITQLGFLLTSLSALNVLIYAAGWSLQLLRIREEEALLMQDAKYQALASKVTYRIIPGVY